ncbi:RND family efflux transporter MFP subunit [Pseudoduganella lurida]|uniref:RND family efflux transporter MFP subunit n=1 Tax=Pseudoduganella lurida TaxID=1036180 RepID=A0A562QWN1_9BURK|nr:efflux RND transporter periplasmic adaptor subunit [Pseudoduganella lurida]TWI61177.1 RND family efflux transporter MFP subunit [Pseudoduganella lurida]
MPSKFKPTAIAAAAAVLVIAVVATGIVSRRSHADQLQRSTSERAIPTVALLTPAPAAADALELPARIEAWSRAPIYARVSGYLQKWNVDIGTPVKAGQTLAIIETPDQDQQLLQAKAELATARSNLVLAKSTAERWQDLLEAKAVSNQEVDERVGDYAAKKSNVEALQANVQRLSTLQRYSRLVAPFDGVVTARNTDVGNLISVGGAAGSELFVVSDLRKLRVYVNVPQRQLARIQPGSKAQITVPERPGQEFTATVQSLAQAISASSGTMLVQLAVDNQDGALVPGAFANARFDSAGASDAVSVPPGSLIVGKNGVQVATVDGSSKVRLQPVTIARDLGNAVQLAGLAPGVRVIANPPDGVANGDPVRVAK